MPNQYLPGVTVIPSSLLITNITKSLLMVVTVSIGNLLSVANTYVLGMAVKLFVPINYGMFQADGLVGSILGIDENDFTLDINSSLFDTFSIPNGDFYITPASISPFGSRNLQYNNETNLVPFQSLNNIGN